MHEALLAAMNCSSLDNSDACKYSICTMENIIECCIACMKTHSTVQAVLWKCTLQSHSQQPLLKFI